LTLIVMALAARVPAADSTIRRKAIRFAAAPLVSRVPMTDWLLQSGSYLGIFAFMVLTGCGLPLPEEVAIVFAGVKSAQGEMVVAAAFMACLLGALIGDAVMYAIGRRFGHSLARRHPNFARLVHAEREEHFERAIQRHGFKVLLLCRFMVGVRGPVYLAAGAVRMPFRRFVLWDLVCATLVVGAFFALSYALGAYFDRETIRTIVRDTEALFTAIVLLVAFGVLVFFALRRHRRRLLEQVLNPNEPSAERDAAPGSARG
jgi:membrane protein DedA with SNARE-associated domain